MLPVRPDYSGPYNLSRTFTEPACNRVGVLKRLYLRVQSAFVAGRLVFMHQAFSGHVIEYGYSRCVGLRCSRFVTCRNSRHHTFYVSAHHRALAGIAGASAFCLTRAFLSLGRIRQDNLCQPVTICSGQISARNCHEANAVLFVVLL